MTSARSAEPSRSADICSSRVGQVARLSSFEEVRARLPTVAARGPYESTADYERRLAQAATQTADSVIVRRHPDHPGEGLVYDADRQTLTVYDSVFGASQVDFSNVFPGTGLSAKEDNFTSAVGFQIEAVETGRSTYEATNAFGAHVTVARTDRRVSAIWERAGRPGESQFVGVGSFKPLARIQMPPEAARELVEGGSAALLFVPKPPYAATGTSVLEASFTSPQERHDTINVIVADIQCAFLLNRAGVILYAFQVR